MRLTLLILISISSQSIIADPMKCSNIENDIERLACYDNLYRSSFILDETSNELITEDLVAIKEEKLILKEQELNKREEVLELKEKELDSNQERRWFGFSKRIQEPDQDEIKILSKIETVATKLNYQLLIILENDQHWVSVEKYRRHKLKDGYDVEITRGFLSGFALRVPDKKIKIRVTRIK
tara:strand:+ start:724 stop:1269 length:546 start_codon:yes stop_codon:yes gene_type:complete